MSAGDFYTRRNASASTAIPNGGTAENAGWDTLVQDEGGIVSYSGPYLQLDIGLSLS